MSNSIKKHLIKAVAQIVGPSTDSIEIRKKLTDGEVVDFTFTVGRHTKRYKLESIGDKVRVNVNLDDWIEMNFVPYSSVDAEYLAAFDFGNAKGELILPDDDLAERFLSRF
ncbi:hypothetical protein [Vibrio harveyi]|uniref:hypothetical protein n=1 Tax=Vibrio harveyi TaxID=669 RepID=UPI003CF0D132